MAIKLVECMCWPAPNKPGKLLQYAEHLKKEKVNLDAFFAYSTSAGQSKIAAIGKAPAKLRAALAKGGVDAETGHCFYLSGGDKAGALVDALKKLARAGVNIECADAVAGGGKFGATLFVDKAHLAKAKKALKAR
ncbi:MAG: hypothetical protein HY077_00120 [Elusimicrobia bacterium]|nr:hypothetical protein [Elusimicrobiota bacterium]